MESEEMKRLIRHASLLSKTLTGLPIVPQGGGIMLSEMLLFITACIEQGVTRIIESGRKAGYSTEILHHFADRFELFSIDRTVNPDEEPRIIASCPRTRILVGDGAATIPPLIHGRTALLLDGPKGFDAYDVFTTHRNKIVMAAIHDLCKLQHDGNPNICRAILHAKHPDMLFSDDDEWLAAYAEMDRYYWSWQGQYSSREELTRNSFTLAVIKGELWR